MRNPIILMLTIILTIALSPAISQSPTRIGNLLLVGTIASSPQVRLTLADGSVVDADIDTSTLVVVVQPNGKPLLRAISTGSSNRVYDRVAAVDTGDTSGRTFVLPVPAANMVVHRDGLRQRREVSGTGDYVVVDSQTIRFVSYYTGQAGASVLVDYDPL